MDGEDTKEYFVFDNYGLVLLFLRLIKLNSEMSYFTYHRCFIVSELMLRRTSASTSGNSMFNAYRALFIGQL